MSLNICYNCLSLGHHSSKCNSRGRCHECRADHHTMLREGTVPTPQVETAQVNLGQIEDSPTVFETFVMRTALADVHTDRKSTTAKIFFDEGAQVSLISQCLTRSLGAKLTPLELNVDCLGSGSLPSRYMTNVKLSSANDLESPSVIVSCHVVDYPMIVNRGVDSKKLRQEMTDHQLEPWADPQVGESTSVDILLGCRHTNHCYKGPDFYSAQQELHFVHTIFGWTVAGSLPSSRPQVATAFKISATPAESADQIMERL